MPKSLLTAISVLDSLVRAGMRHLLISPGSRNAPLAYAAAALDRAGVLTAHVRIDERSAAFTALGIAKTIEKPVGIVVTSGSAVGELLPAVMEAYHSGIPLVIISADRPGYLRGTGANQTTDQAGMLSNFVRAQADLTSYPEDEAGQQTQDFSTALAVAFGRRSDNWNFPSGQPVGPVHLNLAFDTPLSPSPQLASYYRRWAQTLTDLDQPPLVALGDADWVDWHHLDSATLPERKTLVIAGDGGGPLAQRFAQKHRLPLLAEPSSGARFSRYAINAYRDLLPHWQGEKIERVVLFGHPTLSRSVTALLNDPSLEKALYMKQQASWFVPGRRQEKTLASLLELAQFAGRGSQGWLEAWQEAGDRRRQDLLGQVKKFRESAINEGRAAGMSLALAAWQQAVANQEILVCGSSNIIRDLDRIAPASNQAPRVFASRGLAGIDGMLATAAGVSLASFNRRGGSVTPVRLLCGDLTFLHDAMSMNIGPLEQLPSVKVDVFDDGGGGIFAGLEHGQLLDQPDFSQDVKRFMSTPHAVDIKKLAQVFADKSGFEVRVHSGS
ncbi:MAG: 2-succinyl-5-enolpyruvyl-6-hydroxy-3-cyclohexene-1-carboxylic-acid synthase [Rothia sp. (in: high G+C Gram-positive bacteria)]|nr:2-succinyl-5-enolpyruvyl-6-hydroxy-3-cyclohexene-1-carboxylic-acid synthase [Rothia sp. (in: high G+C Gram-positive bacteria)]